jgi:hypothetical protein
VLLKLTTIAAAFLVWAPVAQAWSWPVQGPVLQPFSYDPARPYAAGQHRGIDIGAAATGGPVVAPASGTVSFAGSVPTSGKCVTIETADGYSVTLTHLGSIAVAKGATVAERAVIGTVGPTGTPEETVPYVHLGIRSTSDANGYLDPLSLLPALAAPPAGSAGGSSASAGAGDGSSSAPAPTPTPAPVSEHSPVVAAPTTASTAVSGSAGLVVRSQLAAPPAIRTQPRTTTEQRARDARRPTAKPATEPQTMRRPLEEPSRGRPAAPVTPPVQATPTPALAPLALGAGPGLVAALAALATAFPRLRRRTLRPRAVVVRHPLRAVPPGENDMRRAA